MKKNMMKFRALLLSLVIMLCGCTPTEEEIPSEIIGSNTVTAPALFPAEACGVTLEKAVEKAVSLSPALTEVICELGFKSSLVGISSYCDYPAELTAARVGSPENPDLDAIIALKPDAVFTLTPLSERETYILGQSEIVVLNAPVPNDTEGYSLMYSEIAAAFFGKELVETENNSTESNNRDPDNSKPTVRRSDKVGEDALAALVKASGSAELGSFIYVTGKKTVAGFDTFESSVLGLAGENICKRTGYVTLEEYWEELTDLSPAYMIADSSITEEAIRESATLNKLLNNGTKLRFVSARCFERPSARTAEVFTELSE